MPLWSLLAQSQPTDLVRIIDKVARAPISVIVIISAVATLVRLVVFPILMNTPSHKRGAGHVVAKLVNEAADAFVYAAVVIFLLVRPFGIQTFVIPSGSMVDALHVGDYIVANKWVYRVSPPKRGDIVVFKPPAWVPNETGADQDFIKRLIGEPGDLVELKDAKLYRNGKPVDEPYWTYTDHTHEGPVPKEFWKEIRIPDWKLVERNGEVTPLLYLGDSANQTFSETQPNPKYAVDDPDEMLKLIGQPALTVPQGYYLFMGDNRNGSNDGRMWGLVPRDQIVGKAWFVWLPFSRVKAVDRAPAGTT